MITGGGGVLAGAIAKGFALAGANVILWGIGQSSLDAKVKELVENGVNPKNLTTVEVDLLEESQIETALRKSTDKFGKIDILVNSVGGSSIRCPLVDVEKKEFENVLNLNLLAGCILPTKHIAGYWIDEKVKGVIVNMASMGSFNPLSGAWAYSAAKAAVVNQTMAHAKELAPYGVRVNAIAPGFFLGKQNKKLLIDEDGTPTERGKKILARTPMNRFGRPDDLAAAAIFLASNGAGFISGVTLPVDGAYLCDNI